MRSFVAVVAGYAVFAASAVALFSISGHDPHSSASAPFLAGAVVYGSLFGVLSGFVAAWIAGRRPYLHASIVGLIIASIATASLVAQPGAGRVWTQLSAIFVFAPLTLAGAKLRHMADRRKPGATGPSASPR